MPRLRIRFTTLLSLAVAAFLLLGLIGNTPVKAENGPRPSAKVISPAQAGQATITLPSEDDIEANIRAFSEQMRALQAATIAKVQAMQGTQ